VGRRRSAIRRLAHHRTVYKEYWDSPRADISRDGRFVVFTSNYGGLRRDVFILKVPPSAGDGQSSGTGEQQSR
jgi:Tol biopolymer transport system component